MRPARTAACLAALLFASAGAWAGPPAPADGNATTEGLRRLDAYEVQTRLEDQSTAAQRRSELQRLESVGNPDAAAQARARWRQEDARQDAARDRELDAIARSVRSEQSRPAPGTGAPGTTTATPPGPHVTTPNAFEQRLETIERRQDLERLRRDTTPKPP
jgi:hypothetical protein